MIRRFSVLGLCVGLTSTALAESGAAPVHLGVPAEIPSGGVLPITADCYDAGCKTLASVYVMEMGGAQVEGYFELVPARGTERWGYFVPDEPFRPGAKYQVRSAGYAYATSLVSVSAEEPAVLDETALHVTAELTTERQREEQVCCPRPIPMTGPKRPPRCLDMGNVGNVALTTTLSTVQPSATQYVYELSVYPQGATAGSSDAAFAPLLSSLQTGPRTVRFDGAADSYCYAVRARPIVGGDPTTVLTRCIPNDFASTGLVGRSPEEVAQWRTTCVAIPEEVDAGTLSSDQADASLDGDGEPLGRGADDLSNREESGCQLAGGPARAAGIVWWSFASLALALARRRRLFA